MAILSRLDDLVSMLRVKYQYSNVTVALRPDQEDLRFCYDILTEVSRSFAAVIIQLHPDLRDAVCIFYLVLRGLDSVEDDMKVPLDVKERELPIFHTRLQDSHWCLDGVGDKPKEVELLQQFYRVSREHQKLKRCYQDVIEDICHKMALGMLHFLKNEVVTTADYDLYCHYVAGLVGHGLTRLFASSGLEDPSIADDLRTANSMGLFLQKTNIIRDYFEDIRVEPTPRMFWPRQIWEKFSATKRLDYFMAPEQSDAAVECLNAMVTDALHHIPDCIGYIKRLHHPTVLLFCGIPQIMAIATLSELYGNKDVFQIKVKITKAETCKIILRCGAHADIYEQFATFMEKLESRLDEEDPSFEATKMALGVAWRAVNEARTEEGGSALATKSVPYSEGFFSRYPALGGHALNRLVRSTAGLFGGTKGAVSSPSSQ